MRKLDRGDDHWKAIRRRRTLWPLLALLLLVGGTSVLAAGKRIERVSVSSSGREGNGESGLASISADGRYVVFDSLADNLVAESGKWADTFVRDRVAGTTELVSISTDGTPADRGGSYASISADGRYVVFSSSATNLVPGATDDNDNLYVRDRLLRTTERVSVSRDGLAGNKDSTFSAISADGRFVAFESEADNLAAGDTNGREDVFLRDLMSRTTELVSVSSRGISGDEGSWGPAISADGRYVAFASAANNLTPSDRNGVADVFVRDRLLKRTERISVASDGTPGNGGGDGPAISGDGRYVAFSSIAGSLVPGNTGGKNHIYVRDRMTQTTVRVSAAANGTPGNGNSRSASISEDGRYVAFSSEADNLAADDWNSTFTDVFVRDLASGATELVSLAPGEEPFFVWGDSILPSISGDGRSIVFESDAEELVPNDTNERVDVFVAERW